MPVISLSILQQSLIIQIHRSIFDHKKFKLLGANVSLLITHSRFSKASRNCFRCCCFLAEIRGFVGRLVLTVTCQLRNFWSFFNQILMNVRMFSACLQRCSPAQFQRFPDSLVSFLLYVRIKIQRFCGFSL